MRQAARLGALALVLSAALARMPARADNLLFVPLAPCRVIDTREAGGALAPGVARRFFLRGPSRNYQTAPAQGGNPSGCGIPDLSSDGVPERNLARAVAINLVAVGAAGPGHLTAWPANQPAPLASVVNYAAIGSALANGIVLPMCDEVSANPCAGGDIAFVAAVSPVHLVVDVVGYYHAGATRHTTSNTAVGDGALAALAGGATGNTALGHQALHRDTGGSFAFEGSYNTALGDGALRENTLGNSNTATGFQSLNANTVGFHNTATGAFALAANVDGVRNTATGHYALRSNTAGTDNTAAGFESLQANTTGHSNTAVGTKTLAVNRTGSLNTATGAHAMPFNTEGLRNTASGAFALFANSAGSDNTAAGSYALAANTEGGRNTAVGHAALNVTTASSSNTAVGAHALAKLAGGLRNAALGDAAGFNVTSSNDSVFIGNQGVASDTAVIRIGTAGVQQRTYVAGVYAGTVSSSTGSGVLVDAVGRLGTQLSTRAVKQDVEDLAGPTERLLALRPVAFRYREEVAADASAPLQFGLIAEEVAAVFPELVVRDAEGRPLTVKYHLLGSLLLAALQNQQSDLAGAQRRLDEQRHVIDRQGAALAELRDELERLAARLALPSREAR